MDHDADDDNDFDDYNKVEDSFDDYYDDDI